MRLTVVPNPQSPIRSHLVAEHDSEAYLSMDLLRFTTAGSVDDGKSTLIGRLLYDSKAIFEDQMEAVERASLQRGDDYVDLALLTDGLRAEREQGITIDVAYRYFATPKRKFIIADTPGHIQYTRNMVTGASTAELAIILIDARNGVLTQSKRHGFLASLLQIPHILVAVNKMDLVDYDEEVYDQIVDDYTAFASKLCRRRHDLHPHLGAQGRQRGPQERATCPGTTGRPSCTTSRTSTSAPAATWSTSASRCRWSMRPNQDFRGFAGQIASGSISPGEEIVVLPSGKSSRVAVHRDLDGDLTGGVTRTTPSSSRWRTRSTSAAAT